MLIKELTKLPRWKPTLYLLGTFRRQLREEKICRYRWSPFAMIDWEKFTSLSVDIYSYINNSSLIISSLPRLISNGDPNRLTKFTFFLQKVFRKRSFFFIAYYILDITSCRSLLNFWADIVISVELGLKKLLELYSFIHVVHLENVF